MKNMLLFQISLAAFNLSYFSNFFNNSPKIMHTTLAVNAL